VIRICALRAEHSLNLVGETGASTVPEAVEYFSILQQLHVSFSGSSVAGVF